jgi:UDP-N-acetylglucosamine kinase
MRTTGGDHLLSARSAREVFDSVIVPALLARRPSSARPLAVLIGGQPGAGKSMVQSRVLRQLDRDHAVALDADDLRAFHPDYERLARADDRSAAAATQADVRRWHVWASEYALERGLDVVVSTTLRDEDDAARQVRRWHRGGYRIDVVYVAVDLARSGLGVLRRYVDGRKDPVFGYGRYVPRDYQLAAYAGLPRTAERLDGEAVADRVHVFLRGGERIYTNHLDRAGRWVDHPAARSALEAERHRRWSSEEWAVFEKEARHLREVLPGALWPDLDAVLGDAEPTRPGAAVSGLPGPS